MKHSFSFKTLIPSFNTKPLFYFLLPRTTLSADYIKEIISRLLETKMTTFILIYSYFSCLDYQVLPLESRK